MIRTAGDPKEVGKILSVGDRVKFRGKSELITSLNCVSEEDPHPEHVQLSNGLCVHRKLVEKED
jgi:hypothetical protein